jgi:hypothetical protein
MEKTMALTVTRQRRLEMQGFICSHDGDFARVAPWLRWSPALCMIVAAIGTALASPPILLALAATAALGAILPFHPFDLIYNYGIRYATGTRPLPGNGAGVLGGSDGGGICAWRLIRTGRWHREYRRFLHPLFCL